MIAVIVFMVILLVVSVISLATSNDRYSHLPSREELEAAERETRVLERESRELYETRIAAQRARNAGQS